MDDNQKIAQIDGETIRYQLSDLLGSASLELDENAEIISYEEYYPFGTTSYRSGRNETEVSQKRYKYVMKELDNETGLYYYGARYYASWICRFISVDPLQHEYPELTSFQYASNRPISGVDLDGAEYISFDDYKNRSYLEGGTDKVTFFDMLTFFSEKVKYNNKDYLDIGRHIYSDNKGNYSIENGVNKERLTSWIYRPVSPTLKIEDLVTYSETYGKPSFHGFKDCAASAAKTCYNAGSKPLPGWFINRIYMFHDDPSKISTKLKLPDEKSKRLALDLIHYSLERGKPHSRQVK